VWDIITNKVGAAQDHQREQHIKHARSKNPKWPFCGREVGSP
jgi:hypothetical protein